MDFAVWQNEEIEYSGKYAPHMMNRGIGCDLIVEKWFRKVKTRTAPQTTFSAQ